MPLLASGLLRGAATIQRCSDIALLAGNKTPRSSCACSWLSRIHSGNGRRPSPAARGLSTSALGTLYEEHCLRSLQSLLPGQVQLQKIGGRGDRGIDLTGWWTVPLPPGSADTVIPRRVRMFVQCKSTLSKTKKLGPVALREMEGVLGRYRTRLGVTEPTAQTPYEEDATTTPLMAVICSSSGFSKATNTQVSALDGVNFLLVHLPLPVTVLEMLRSSGEEDAVDGNDSQAADTADYPTTVLCSPSLVNNHGSTRLGGYFDLQWERVIPEARRHAEDSQMDAEVDEGPGVGLRPVLTWRHCN